MNDRETILSRTREITSALPKTTPLPSLESVSRIPSRNTPDPLDHDAVVDRFKERWTLVHGRIVESESELVDALKLLGANKGYVDPALELTELKSAFSVDERFDRSQVDAYTFGVSRATTAIAESGTLVLTDRDTPNRLAALAPWIHVAVLKREAIQATMGEAMRVFGKDPSIVLVTGPSKTADIEGILIEGVHGPGIQFCLLI